jgi:sugar lactone lactonase YvrE
VNGRRLRRLDGQPPHFSADGIAIDQAGQYVCWQATTGTVMYRAALALLFDPGLSAGRQSAAVESVANTFVADGYRLARNGVLYLTSAPRDNSVKRHDGASTFRCRTPACCGPTAWPRGRTARST